MPRASNCDVLIDWMAEHLGEEGRRSAGNPLRSRPSRRMVGATMACVAAAAVFPYTGLGAQRGRRSGQRLGEASRR